jgi:hypothetical protein
MLCYLLLVVAQYVHSFDITGLSAMLVTWPLTR